VERRVKEEEGKIFKTAEKVLGEDKLQSIMKQFEQEKQKLKESLK
jgi:hemerythrin-like domain-containing protein